MGGRERGRRMKVPDYPGGYESLAHRTKRTPGRGRPAVLIVKKTGLTKAVPERNRPGTSPALGLPPRDWRLPPGSSKGPLVAAT